MPDEVDRLIQACQTSDEKLVIITLLETGLRISEFLSLTPAMINWQDATLVVHGKGGPFGTRSKRRIVPLSDRARAILTHHFTVNDKIALSPSTVRRLIHRVANRAKISRPVCPHVLRHTFAVRAIRAGISLPALQRILGHENLDTTAVYLNMQPQQAIEEFRQKWARPTPALAYP